MKGWLQVGYNIVKCGDGYYIAGEEGKEKGKSEGKSAGFIPEKKKIVIYTREKLQKQGFSSSCYNSLCSDRFSKNCFYIPAIR